MSATDSAVRRYTQADPDVRLMLQVRAGDAAAFEELMLRYQNRVVAILEHLVGKRGEAEDLAQDVFLRVYRARDSYVPGAKFATWLFTIAHNVGANALRSRSRRHEVQAPSSAQSSGEQPANPLAELAAAASGQMPTRQADKAEMQSIVRLAIEQLSDRQRMAVLLNKFEDMSYAEIAEIMHLTPKSIKSLMARARENLRQALEPYLQRGDRPAASP